MHIFFVKIIKKESSVRLNSANFNLGIVDEDEN